ncbi:hypothetical protein ACTHPH_10390 [Paenibacillus pasadenensis]|uniref:hypothetical protein n=1 Tax=Paenibacillus pasadenensis TaxID=217090 RepID=UPI000406E5A6|nr:hypothetical protein [Paenibacillus pasadenensis]
MGHRNKRKKRSVVGRGGPRAGRLLLALAMAAAVVPAVLGYLNHRELERGTTETAMALLPQRSAAPAPSPAGAAADPGEGTGASGAAASGDGAAEAAPPLAAGAGDAAKEASGEAPQSAAAGAEGDAEEASQSAGAGAGGIAKEASRPGGAGAGGPSPAGGQSAGQPAGAAPSAAPSAAKPPAASAEPDTAVYERRLETIREQCVSAGASVLQEGEARLREARSGELTEQQRQQAGAELAGEMEAAESGCRSRFDRLIAEAEQANVPESERSKWKQSYEQSRELLRAGLSKQLDALASAADPLS